MAEKRRIEVYTHGQDVGQEEDELPHKLKDISWKEWLREDFARYWFVTLALAVDVLFGLEVINIVSGAALLGSAIFLVIVVPVEVFIYIYLWGKNGVLMSEK